MAGHRVALTAGDPPVALTAGDPPVAPDVAARPIAPPVALYVHVPFCVSLCPYCDFVVYAGSDARGPRSRIAAFVDALLTEIDLRADAATALAPLASVYLGGGTPSLLPTESVAAILARVRARFGIAEDAEVTLEANPGPDERGQAAGWRDAGVTRLSFGAQSLDQGELRRLGRRHRPSDVRDAVADARAAGIGSVSLDLLYDVPGQTVASWAATLEEALALDPDHLSLYALTLDDPDAEGLTGPTGDHLPTTRGARRWRRAAVAEQDDDRAADQYRQAAARLAAEGFRGYEISNWARPDHECRHNLAYWERRPYEAVGPGAHAFDGTSRRWNAARLDRYLAALTPADGSAARLPPGDSETIDAPTAAAEAAILALRLDTGLPLAAADDLSLAEALNWARAVGLLRATDDDRLVLTTDGRLLSNEVFARLTG
jgi:oxygen-independent coproporphyrinogen-3 oxidase